MRCTCHLWALGVLLSAVGSIHLSAQDGFSPIKLTYESGSSKKIEQVNGDCDWVAWDASGGTNCVKTASQTTTRFDVLGDDIGSSFEHNGQLIFVFGDTIGATDGTGNSNAYYPTWIPFVNNYLFQAHDPIGWSTTQSPSDPLLLNYFPSQTSSALPLLVEPVYTPGSTLPACVPSDTVPMGIDEVPNSGISLDGQIYLVVNTNADNNLAAPQLNACSILVRFDESTSTFTAGRELSQSYYPLPEDENPPLTVAPPPGTPEGHFVFTSLHELPAGFGEWGPGRFEPPPFGFKVWEGGVLIFGEGQSRGKSSGTSVYMSYIPKDSFWSGIDGQGASATRYFTGLKHGHPTWSMHQNDAVPVVYDNPNNVPVPTGPPGFADPGTVGNMSVVYSEQVGLWLMTYDGGRQPGPNEHQQEGIYFSYAPAPWGPWAKPQLIFNACADGGFGNFMFYYYDKADPTKNTCPSAITDGKDHAGPAGPAIGQNDPNKTPGDPYSAFILERFTTVDGDTLKLYYTMATWNPYAIVRMESDFTISFDLPVF